MHVIIVNGIILAENVRQINVLRNVLACSPSINRRLLINVVALAIAIGQWFAGLIIRYDRQTG